jgi:hypothetical protein
MPSQLATAALSRSDIHLGKFFKFHISVYMHKLYCPRKGKLPLFMGHGGKICLFMSPEQKYEAFVAALLPPQ